MLSCVTMMLVQRLQMFLDLLNLVIDFVLAAAQALRVAVRRERRLWRLAYPASTALPSVPLVGLFP
ncbi:AB hydrolase-1 domain-containing protein [Psidium guajava]|nr:AB hydrolase-1 domain-containing protein [Psidium guajava]